MQVSSGRPSKFRLWSSNISPALLLTTMYQSRMYSCKLYLSFLLSFLASMLMLYRWESQISCRRCSKLLTSSVVASGVDQSVNCAGSGIVGCIVVILVLHCMIEKSKQSYCAELYWDIRVHSSSAVVVRCNLGLFDSEISWAEWVDAYVQSTCSSQTCSCMEKVNSELQN